ncbi:MAG: NADP(H)-dependent aldo-keto reductase [Thermostichus sp. DG02_5_bins_236]
MRYLPLGHSSLTVSEICLGTMTFGQQNTMAEAHEQLDYALAQGINFIDAAEMYPVPARAETQGSTERYIGEWLQHQRRDRLVIATKITGPGRPWHWIRNGSLSINRDNVKQAVADSLKRLKTDYIDLYQIHWPDRYVPQFGAVSYDPSRERPTVPIAEQLEALAEMVQAGLIRYIGLSNETPWGVSEFCHLAEQLGLPKVVSIQNAYNLINRVFEVGLAEVCRNEQIGLLAYSPLGFGVLTGKYLQAEKPTGSRLALFEGFGQRYLKPNVAEAVAGYASIAQKYGLTPAQLALAFVRSRWFMTSTIIGATNLAQLKENLSCLQVELSTEMLAEIEAVHQRYPNPAP